MAKLRSRVFLNQCVTLVRPQQPFANPESPKGYLFVRSSCEAGSAVVPDETTTSLLDLGPASEMVLAQLLKEEQLSHAP